MTNRDTKDLTNPARCSVCGRLKLGCKSITLTEAEKKAVVEAFKVTPLESYVYCKSCWTALNNPTAPALMANLTKKNLQRLGVNVPNNIAETYAKKLEELRKKS